MKLYRSNKSWRVVNNEKDTSVESTAKCRVKSNATIQNNSILKDGRDTRHIAGSIIFSVLVSYSCKRCM